MYRVKCIQGMYRACIQVCILTLKCKYRLDTDVSLRIHLDTLDTRWIRAGYVSKARYMADTYWIRIEGKLSLFRGKSQPFPPITSEIVCPVNVTTMRKYVQCAGAEPEADVEF